MYLPFSCSMGLYNINNEPSGFFLTRPHCSSYRRSYASEKCYVKHLVIKVSKRDLHARANIVTYWSSAHTKSKPSLNFGWPIIIEVLFRNQLSHPFFRLPPVTTFHIKNDPPSRPSPGTAPGSPPRTALPEPLSSWRIKNELVCNAVSNCPYFIEIV
jgi:hypothetical protein